jgi:hypothetical protein
MRVLAGNLMSASVTVHGHDVTLRVRDLSTGARYTVTKRVPALDVSSAEWIVEAPSVCFESGSCAPLALTDFGSVAFSTATATAAAHSGTIADPRWSAEALELRQDAGRALGRPPGRRFNSAGGSVVSATPTMASSASGAFTVAWKELSATAEAPTAPSLPGFNGGPP